MFSSDMNLLEKIRVAGESGFDGIEPWVNEFELLSIKDVVKCCNDYNILIPTMIKIAGWFEDDGGLMNVGDNHDEIIEECKRRMDLSVSVGCGWIVAVPCFSHRGKVGEWNKGVDYFCELMDIGKVIGCDPTIEFIGQTDLINNFSICKKFIDEVGNGCRMVIDSYHLWRGGGSVDDFVGIDASQVSVFHISDADRMILREDHRDSDRVMPLDGKIELEKFAMNVKNVDSNCFVNIGVYNKKLWLMNSFEMCRDSLKRLRKLFL